MKCLYYFPNFRNLCLASVLMLVISSAQAQKRDDRIYNAVVEIRNFSEEKTLPLLELAIRDTAGLKIKGYCLGQDLVILSVDIRKFAIPEQVAYFFESKDFVAYLKEGMSPEQVDQECKSAVVKLKNQ